MYINRHGLQFSTSDTFDYTTLGELMVKWLERFKEDYQNPDLMSGIPNFYLEQKEDPNDFNDEELEQAKQLFIKDIDDVVEALIDMEDEPDFDNYPQHQWSSVLQEHYRKREEQLMKFARIYTMLWR